MRASKQVQKTAEQVTEDTREQLLYLRNQVEQLLNERVTPALADAAERAETVVHTARDYTTAKAEDVSKKVKGQPLIAVAISAAVGYLLGRIAR